MLRITRLEEPGGGTTLRLEGRLVGPWVGALRGTSEGVLARGAPLTLDLSHVSFVDPDGVALLRSMGGPRVTLVNCTPFVAEQLRTGPR
jgi:hypothetical protein